MRDWDYGYEFAEPGSNSALRAATELNPRNLPCPTCEYPNRLTPMDVNMGYQCNSCADAMERGHDIDYWEPSPRENLGTIVIDSEDEESYTRITTYKVDADLSDEAITEWVEDEFPSEYCKHEHDCCAQFYGNKGVWACLNTNFRGGKLIAVTQSFRLNI